MNLGHPELCRNTLFWKPKASKQGNQVPMSEEYIYNRSTNLWQCPWSSQLEHEIFEIKISVGVGLPYEAYMVSVLKL